MEPGKLKCKLLRSIREHFARINNIEYVPAECHHKGDCKGTCPACDAELKYLEDCIQQKMKKGETVVYMGDYQKINS